MWDTGISIVFQQDKVRTNTLPVYDLIPVRNKSLTICAMPENSQLIILQNVRRFHLGKQQSPIVAGKKALSEFRRNYLISYL